MTYCVEFTLPKKKLKVLNVKYKYEPFFEQIVRGCIARAKINWYKKGEQNSKYFFNLKNTGFVKTAVFLIFDSKGSMTLNAKTIINELKHYY